jgi:adenylate kinase family enzyme
MGYPESPALVGDEGIEIRYDGNLMELYIIAGPNGAGKTTFAREFLPNYAGCKNFVNADLIAQGMAPFSPETAACAQVERCLRRSGHLPRGVSLSLSRPRSQAEAI